MEESRSGVIAEIGRMEAQGFKMRALKNHVVEVDKEPRGFIRVVDREGHLVRTLMASVEPVMDSLPIEILESIQEWALDRHPECSVIIK